jgi:signal transduction histidine kinase
MGLLTLSERISQNIFRRYAAALAATAIALVVRRALHPFLGDSLPYVTLFPAVAFSAWVCGVGPSLFAILVGLAGARFWFLEPAHTLGVWSTPQAIDAAVFVAACALMVAIGEVSRRNNEMLRLAQGDLEEMVKQRTVELDAANQSLGELTARLMKLQDEERRRIARELHDSVGQTLAALSMNLSAIGGDIAKLAKTASAVTDSAALVAEMSADIRTISHLLHPPLLDEAGLSSALRWYIEGFAERSKIKVDLKVADDLGRLPSDLETAIFRVVQECLTNIHRHSESPVARVRVASSGGDVQVEVEDEGKGIPQEKQAEMVSSGLPGVGLRGMRERLRQLGGSLEIKSAGAGKGTVVMARLPVVAPAAAPEIASAMAAGAGD